MKLKQLKVSNPYLDMGDKYYDFTKSQPLMNPFLISYSKDALALIDIDENEADSLEFVNLLNSSYFLEASKPYAMAYSGHQFGYFVPNLGDGRATNLGKINSWNLQLKGSGLTKYSRQGDGRAVLRSSIREFLVSEAMYALHIPTTRAAGLIGSTHPVFREYEQESGAIVLRLSPSWIRIGTFEFFYMGKDKEKNIKILADFVIEESYPHLKDVDDKYERFFEELVENTAKLLASWQSVGFMHGVMNSDNMSVAGVTIDYGPYAFMDIFDKHCICNHSDYEGRYSYNNQPFIAKWNLGLLSNALSVIAPQKNLEKILSKYMKIHQDAYIEIMKKKLGLIELEYDKALELVIKLLETLEKAQVDYTPFFYRLSKIDKTNYSLITDICIDRVIMQEWLNIYFSYLELESDISLSKEIMKKTNPKYVLKNYILQEAIEKAQDGDFSFVSDLLEIVKKPFDEHPKFEKYANPTPYEHVNLKLSCSS